MADALMYPEVINNFNVYDDGDKMQGTSGEITLPTLSAITTEISGGASLEHITLQFPARSSQPRWTFLSGW